MRSCPGHDRPEDDVTRCGRGGVKPLLRWQLSWALNYGVPGSLIAAFTKELSTSYDPLALGVTEGDLLNGIALGSDTALTDAEPAVSNGRPAGLLNGVSPIAW
jgi:hypothetical protein